MVFVPFLQLFLIFVIVCFVSNETFAAGMRRLPGITEFCSPRSVINIPIIDATENVNLSFFGDRIFQWSDVGKRAFGNFRLVFVEQEARQGWSCLSHGDDIFIVFFKEFVGQSFREFCRHKICVDSNVVSGSLTKVADGNNDIVFVNESRSYQICRLVVVIFNPRAFKGQFFNTDISSQFTFFSAFSTLNQFIGSGGYAYGEEAENYCKNGYESSSNCDDLLMMVVSKSPEFVQADFEDGARRDAIIFIGLCCLAAFATFY